MSNKNEKTKQINIDSFLFYDGDALTSFGVLCLMGLGIGLVPLVISFVRGLVQRR